MGSSHSPRGRSSPTYTPASARRALPLLSAIARDAHETYLSVRGRLATVDGHRPLEGLVSDSALPEALREELAAMRDHVRELADLGARLGDPELGLVLLDAVVEGRPGSLCWKIGEDTIRYWYPLGERYEDRRPLPAGA